MRLSFQRLNVQQHVIHAIVLPLLCDEDGRVRHAAAAALCRLVPRLYHHAGTGAGAGASSTSQPADPIIARAHAQSAKHLSPVLHESSFSTGPQPGE